MIGRWFKLRRLRSALGSKDPSMRRSGLEQAPDLTDPAIVEAIASIAVSDPDSDCRTRAGEILSEKKPPQALSALRRTLLVSMQIDERMRAAQLLSRIGGPEAIAALARGVEDFTFRHMQEHCVRALAATRDPAVIPLLGKFANDSFWYPSRKRRVGGSGIDIGYDEGAVAREDARVRATALEGLSSMGGEEALAILRRHLKDSDIIASSVARKAIAAAEKTG